MLSPHLVELFLRSSGAPPAVIEMFHLIRKEGWNGFKFGPLCDGDSIWDRFGVDADRTRTGIAVRAEGQTSRVTALLLFEGVNDETIQLFNSLSGASLASESAVREPDSSA